MTHKPGHKTHPEYDKLSKATSPDFWESKQGDGAAK